MTARELDSQFEWTAHEPAALRDGLDQAIIDVVKYRKPLSGLRAKEALIIRFGRELFRRKKVRSQTFASYAMTAVMFNAVDQHLRPGQRPLLPRG